jgi:ABC-type branched-subunit amino acid transport system ATPase component
MTTGQSSSAVMSSAELPLPVLSVRGLVVAYGGVKAVDGAGFDVVSGERLGIIGPNGAGKTTMLNAIAGEISSAAGSILFDGKEIRGRPAWRIARSGVSRTFQSAEVFPSLTVNDNFRVVGRGWRRSGTHSARGRPARPVKNAENVDAMIRALGLSDLAHESVGSLPYGRQRIVELGRALMMRPKLLLLDEPTAGLNSHEKREFAMILDGVAPRGEISLVMIEHDMETIDSVCGSHVLAVALGKVIAEGTFAEVTSNAEVIKAYFG